MASLTQDKLIAPLENYVIRERGWKFREVLWRRGWLPALHLGEDILGGAGEDTRAIGAGEVVFSGMLTGSENRGSWGGIIVLRHRGNFQIPAASRRTHFQTWYSIYGHLRSLRVEAEKQVKAGEVIGEIAGELTPENGWWKKSHLHLAIYTGPWSGQVLPGWWKIERGWRTRLGWWHNPAEVLREAAN